MRRILLKVMEPEIEKPNGKSQRNMISVEKVALAAIRYNKGERPAAAIATAEPTMSVTTLIR